MKAEMIVGLIIISFVAVIMVVIGLFQVFKKDDPVGFYNVTALPKREEISDIIQWNKKHGRMWIVYGICIELGFWLGYVIPGGASEVVFIIGGIILPLPFMIIGHYVLEKKYRVK